jgi:hypothetical protein
MATATIVIEEFERASICDSLWGTTSFYANIVPAHSHTSVFVVVIAALVCSYSLTEVGAQEVNSPSSSASLERVRVALQQREPSPLIVGPLIPLSPDERRFGIFAFLPPDTRGEFVRVRVPVGALVSGVAHSIAATRHHRAEKAAREDVAKALEEFRKAQAR